MRALAEPFDPREVRFRPGRVEGRRALALAYVDARAVQDRLDRVLGIDGWQDHYQALEGGAVLCRLGAWLGGRWVVRCDVGGPSEQPDEGDRRKAAVSDALKRAAVKFGVGRYLYRLPPQWCDYDPAAGRFLSTPALPDWALPRGGEALARPAAPFTEQTPRQHLLRLLRDKGYSARQLVRRYGVQELGELTLAEYEHAAGSLARLPDRAGARP
jgi:hypothetical protein